MKQKRLEEKLKRRITLDEVHLLCEELGFQNPEDTMRYIEYTPSAVIEDIIAKAKRKKKKKGVSEAEAFEYEYIYST
jgi:hypothetical protein